MQIIDTHESRGCGVTMPPLTLQADAGMYRDGNVRQKGM